MIMHRMGGKKAYRAHYAQHALTTGEGQMRAARDWQHANTPQNGQKREAAADRASSLANSYLLSGDTLTNGPAQPSGDPESAGGLATT